MFGHDAMLSLVQTYGTPLVVALAVIEHVGIPAPAAALLLAASVYAGTGGDIDIHMLVLGSFAGAVIGQIGGYALGRTLGLAVVHRWGRRVGLSEDRLLLGRYLFRHYGANVLIFGRLIAFVRTISGLLAGAAEMPVGRFLLANLAGSALWAALYGYGAWRLGEAMRHIAGIAGLLVTVLLLVAIGLLAVVLHRNHARMMARARAEEAEG